MLNLALVCVSRDGSQSVLMHNYLAGVHLAAVDIFEALEAGVDVFDGSYPTELYALYAGDHSCSCYAACLLCVLSAFTFI